MDNTQKEIWFPAKKYGWGWGFPIAWQGWLVLAVWIAVVFGGVTYIPASGAHYYFVPAFVLVMAVFLLAVWVIKGEKTKWRWGE
jgi:hypothetical protein